MATKTITISGTIELYGISAGGGTKYQNVTIDNSLIQNGTINKVQVKATVRETKRTMWARATGYIGCLNASGGRETKYTISDIPRKNETAKTFTSSSFTPEKYNGAYTLFFGAKNNIATLNDIDVDFYNIEIYIEYTEKKCHVTVLANPEAGGKTYEEGYIYSMTAKAYATPNAGYKFVGWYKDGVFVSTNNPYYFTIKEDVVYVAYFEKIPPPKFTSAEMTYLNKQISETNKVIHREGFIISVGVT